MKVKKPAPSISLKIILVFLLLFIPVILMGSNIYGRGYRIIKNEIENSSNAQLTLYAKSLEDEVLRIQKLQSEYVMEKDLDYLINTYSILDQYERSKYLLQIQERLRILNESSKFIDTITVHIPSLEKTISSSRGIDPLWKNWESAQTRLDHISSSGLTYENGCIYMNMQYPVNVPEGRQPLFIMEISLSNAQILKMLEGFNQYPDSSIFLTNDSHQYLLATDPNALNASPADSLPGYIKDSKKQVITTAALNTLGLRLVSVVPTAHIYGNITNYRFFFFCYVVLAVMIIIAFGLFIHRMIHRPVNNLIQAIKKVEQGDYSATVTNKNEDEFHYLNHSFNKMTQNLQELIHQVYEQKILTQRAELKQLQSQINPHFLYNSFFNIYRLAKDEDYENITAFSQYLGTYYQYITRNANMEVMLLDEYNHAKTYCSIQQMRFHNRLDLRLDSLPEAYQSCCVPRLIIQPIIENAFEHGLKEVESPQLAITFTENEQELYICISDNGPPLPEDVYLGLQQKLISTDTSLETTAIINIHRRLQLKFGSAAGLQLSYGALGGIQIIVHIPAQKRD